MQAQLKMDYIDLEERVKSACSRIDPLWSVENFIAVNPYLGYSNKSFEDTALILQRIARSKFSMPRSFYREQYQKGILIDKDLQQAVSEKEGYHISVKELTESLNQLAEQVPKKYALCSYSNIIGEYLKKDWKRFLIQHHAEWAASFFDAQQAKWKNPLMGGGLFNAWLIEANINRAPLIMGIKNYRASIKEFPADPLKSIHLVLNKLEIPEDLHLDYLSRILYQHHGWASFIRRIDWENTRDGITSDLLVQFLATLLTSEYALFQQFKAKFHAQWKRQLQGMLTEKDNQADKDFLIDLLLQKAFENSHERRLKRQIDSSMGKAGKTKNSRPSIQAIFCIDVRSEVIRRHIEAQSKDIETLGFAGFFSFPIAFKGIAENKASNQCPALLSPHFAVEESMRNAAIHEEVLTRKKVMTGIRKAWNQFKGGAVSCFAYVSPLGLGFLPKLLFTSLGYSTLYRNKKSQFIRRKERAKRSVTLEIGDYPTHGNRINIQEAADWAYNAINALSIRDQFGKTIIICGHGADTINNPQASGLDCGACGGNDGESNAKFAAALLNNSAVRESLKGKSINIPSDTLFIPALHHTTTDEIELFNESEDIKSNELPAELGNLLQKASVGARQERAVRFGNPNEASLLKRSYDWAETRPEWGLAGCDSFIVARRDKTKSLNLNAKTFLHHYDWKLDEDFKVLETILTAPMIVTNWINLQYYASTVDNIIFGSGNKTLHNVIGGIGVAEGFHKDLRTGLSWQSVHDGKDYQHHALRLKVIIDAPRKAIEGILMKHENVKELLDNEWIFLYTLNEEDKLSYKYQKDLQWTLI